MMQESKRKKVMVFGVFDQLHPGHISFLEQAAGYGDELIAVITRDDIALQLKNKNPRHSEKERMLTVAGHPAVKVAILGDFILGSYEIIRLYKPDVICLGYDQQELETDLRERMRRKELQETTLMILTAYQPEIFHTSLLT